MRQNNLSSSPSHEITQYFYETSLPSQQEMLGQIVTEILRSGKRLNRKTICTKLVHRLEVSGSAEEERRYRELIGLLPGR